MSNNQKYRKRELLSIKLICILSIALLPELLIAKIPHGIVHDFKKTGKQVTVMTPNPGIFLPGQKLFVFRNKRIVGEIKVGLVSHTRFNAKVLSGNDFRRKDIAVKKKTDITKLNKSAIKVISFRKIGTPASAWITSVSFPALKGETQTRRLTFSHIIGIRKQTDEFYRQVKTKDLSELHYSWSSGKLTGKRVVYKNRTSIECSEILTPQVLSRIKPPTPHRSLDQDIVIKLIKESKPQKKRPDALWVTVEIESSDELFEKENFYLIKVYSGGLLINEYILSKTMQKANKLETRFQIPGMELLPGKNDIEFQFVVAEKISDDIFQKGEAKLIGKRTINYNAQNFKHNFEITGDGDDLELK